MYKSKKPDVYFKIKNSVFYLVVCLYFIFIVNLSYPVYI